ncbi:MAG: cytochrome b/b6 domain-containing protein [Gammaproteobacteria bacterium]|nr:cytochrome b/b6 domain-containing protein [Gammaproteobacteria bacterium]MDH5731458.1 cytochrome b/b6 domain-containing protein [Gammaproteobacteria bacterium]
MKLSSEAQDVLDVSMQQNKLSDSERQEVEQLIASMPDDRVFLYKNINSNPIGDLYRYSIHIRIQHMLTFVSFLTLAFTGLPIHFFESFWAQPFNSLLGGVDVTRVIHRTIAVIMILTMIYHLVTIIVGSWLQYVIGKFDIRRTIIPLPKDIKDFKEDLLYFSGKREQRPEMDKFMYKQKIHYFAAGFGNTVMVVSGSSFLFPEIWASILPAGSASYFQELMRLSHPHEALLALIVIAFWHWYNVHLAPGRFPMQWTFLTGKITREHQIEEHFLEYLRNLVETPEERVFLRETLATLESYSKDIKAKPSVQNL